MATPELVMGTLLLALSAGVPQGFDHRHRARHVRVSFVW
jgi:hypothetical protein